MNKIYRRLWSTARQCWVVASELSSARGKRSSSGSALSVVMLAAPCLLSMYASDAHAMDACVHSEDVILNCVPDLTAEDFGPHLDVWPTVVAASWQAPGGGVMGEGSRQRAMASDLRTILGDFSEVKANAATALGARAFAQDTGGLAVGHDSRALGENSIAMGSGSRNATGAGISRIAIGGNSYAGSPGWTGAIALGGETEANFDAVAIGYQARARAANSVALGRGSQATQSDTVSVGSSSIKRRIVNVANGNVALNSNDAVNGGQLQSVKDGLGADIGGVKYTADTALRVADSASTTANTARTTANTALSRTNELRGLISQASASGTVRLGAENTGTVLDVRNKGNASRKVTGVADGTLSAASTDAVSGKQLHATNATVTTAQNTANTAQNTASAARTTADSALSKANALGGLVSQVAANGNVRLGGENTGTILDVRNKANASRKVSGVADGSLTATSTEAVNGKQLLATNNNVTAAQNTANGARTTADSALGKANVLGGLLSQTAANGNVRLGGENNGTVLDVRNKSNANRKVTGVADGTLGAGSTDAVNGKQLNDTNTRLASAIARLDAENVAIGKSAVAEGAGGNASTATGQSSKAYNNRSVAIGVDARAGVDAAGNKNAGAHGAVAVGAGSRSGAEAVATGTGAAAIGQQSVAVGTGASATGILSTALGYKATASSGQATALGRESTASGTFSTSIGNLSKATAQSAVALGDRAVADHARSVALGDGSTTTGNNQISVGNNSFKRKIVNMADGAVVNGSSEAVTGSQLHATNTKVTENRNAAAAAQASANQALADTRLLNGLVGQTAADGSVRLGAENTGTTLDLRNKANASRKVSGVADGALTAASTDAVNGKQLLATNSNVTTAQNTANIAQNTATGARTTAESASAKADALGGLVGQVAANGNIRLGAENTGSVIDVANKNGGKRRINNLADGTVSKGSADAVTGSQLFATNDVVRVQGETLTSHGAELSAHDGRIAGNLDELQKLRAEFDDFDPDLDGVVKFDASGNVDVGGGRVTGIAAGDISSAASTDAVNGGQLFATNQRVDALADAGKYLAFGEFLDREPAKAGRFGVALGDSAEASPNTEGAVAVGAYALARGENSVALGRGAHVHDGAARGFALGAESQVAASGGVALGARSSVAVGAENSVAIGVLSVASERDTVSFGNDGLRRRLVNVGRGIGAYDASNIAQLSESLSALGGGSGLDSNGGVVAPTYNVQGGTQNTVGDALSALDSAVVAGSARVDRVENQLRSVFQDTPTVRTDGLNQLTFAGANGMVLSNVANGAIAAGSRDAVNGGQLHSMQQQLNGRMDGLEQRVDGQPQTRAMTVASADAGTPSITPPAPPAETPPTTPPPVAKDDNPIADAGNAPKSSPQPQADAPKPESPKPQVDTAELEKMLARANEYSDGISREVDARLDKMDKRFNRMAAMSSAQTAMAMNTAGLATYNRLGAGVGYAEGESAMAVGYQRVLNDKGSATFSLNGAFTNSGERSMGVGVGIGW